MGCIHIKQKPHLRREINLKGFYNDEERKQMNQEKRMDTCSTAITNQVKTPRSIFFRRVNPLDFSQYNMLETYKSTFKDDLSLKDSQFCFNIQSPFIGGDKNFQLLCEQQNIPIYIQLIYGFPQENIIKVEPSNSRKSYANNIQSFSHLDFQRQTFNFFLHQNVSIFIKFLLQCPKCFKKTKITQCTTMFNFNYSNCNCKTQSIGVRVLQTQPQNIKIWCQQLNQMILAERTSLKIMNKKHRIRAIGCTSCWNFSDMKKRQNCGCAVCDRCSFKQCQICKE